MLATRMLATRMCRDAHARNMHARKQHTTHAFPAAQIGRYYLGGGGDASGRDDGTSYERIRCAKSSVHPSWSFKSGTNDIALCFLESASAASPVTLAARERAWRD